MQQRRDYQKMTKNMKITWIDIVVVSFVAVGVNTAFGTVVTEFTKMKLEAYPERLAAFEKGIPVMLGFAALSSGISSAAGVVVWAKSRESIAKSFDPDQSGGVINQPINHQLATNLPVVGQVGLPTNHPLTANLPVVGQVGLPTNDQLTTHLPPTKNGENGQEVGSGAYQRHLNGLFQADKNFGG